MFKRNSLEEKANEVPKSKGIKKAVAIIGLLGLFALPILDGIFQKYKAKYFPNLTKISETYKTPLINKPYSAPAPFGCSGGDDEGVSTISDNNINDDDASAPGNDDGVYADDDTGYLNDDSVVDDDTVIDDDVDVDCTTRYPDESPYNVIECKDIGADWNCEDTPGCTCSQGYLNFIEKATNEGHAHPISESELERQLENIRNGLEPRTTPLPPEEFKELLIDTQNIRFLREGIDDKPLKVTTIRESETPEYFEKEFLFEDPYVGVFKTLLLTPKSEGPHPGVVALHGHGDSAHSYRDLYGKEFPKHGYAIIMPTQRCMCGMGVEDFITRSLLLNGFSFQGVRSYESLLSLKYLKYLENIKNEKIGAQGFSGGSTVFNHTIRTEQGFQVLVTDNISIYADFTQEGELLDSTDPGLYLLNLLINDFSTSPKPIEKFGHGYPNGIEEAILSLDPYLKP